MQETRSISKSLLRKNFSSISSPVKPKWLKAQLPSKKIHETTIAAKDLMEIEIQK